MDSKYYQIFFLVGVAILGFFLGGAIAEQSELPFQSPTPSNISTNQSPVENNGTEQSPTVSQNQPVPKQQETTQKQVLDPKTLHHKAQLYMDANYGKGYSVAYGGMENGEWKTIVYSPNADNYGYIYQNPYSGVVTQVNINF